MADAQLSLTVQLMRDGDSLRGVVVAQDGIPTPFSGWIGLVSALSQAIDDPGPLQPLPPAAPGAT